MLEQQPVRRFRNVPELIAKSGENLDCAYRAGVMTIYGRSTQERQIELLDGRTIVDFQRGSYLGLDNHPSIVAGAMNALNRYNSLQWSGARTRLNFAITKDLEDSLAGLFGCRAMVFSLVLTANMGVLPLLACGALTNGRRPVIVVDRFAHATISYHKAVMAEDTEVITIDHNNLEELEDICRTRSFVAFLCDGVYSMGGAAPIKELIRLQEKYGLFLYIDDAHGVSIRGRYGEGFARSEFGERLNDLTMIVASLSKGFGVTGSVVMIANEAQERVLRRYAVPHAFSMGPSIPAIGAALASAELHKSPELSVRQSRLNAMNVFFNAQWDEDAVKHDLPIKMIRIGDAKRTISIAASLIENGFYLAAAFFPAVPHDKAALRVCLTADHHETDIARLCALVKDLTKN
ncbi:aminotransferase class I/II-fold pyridoxal phosphate-dependent enzyme [Rhodopseudomonas sp.]|jgi:7-keto-8-aminopelargonate synthetase-like enzyme|uniref:aminotransferase class I/II-fold pyridoxal phosphate-dependent enzyme n=1 Tax=Rhodopseudomonas sp. TaxID=1078 RepID=UPI0039E374FD